MPTFPATAPVPVVVDLPVSSSLHVVASERDDVVVTVLPADPTKPGDVRAADDVRVERAHDAVTITGPRAWKQYVPFAGGSITVTVELPAGSHLRGSAGTLFAEGPLGTVEVSVTAGDARIDDASRLNLRCAAGSVVLGRISGTTSVRVSAGSVRVAEIAGEGTIRSSAGSITVARLDGSLDASVTHGDLAVGTLRGTLHAKAASGGLRVDRLESGEVTLATSYGSIDVGVPEGTAAWLDVSSQHGSVRNQLRPTGGPVDGDDTARIHASTGYGDVVVRRP
ncbi:MAG TPA: DUF4097 family beta strand repeat-containing protein [Actinomycetales bacterium]|jgi:hypothetical protein